jgi:hypothetical protein
LTRGALTVNTEVGVVVSEAVGGTIDVAWETLLATSEVLDERLLKQYERNRNPQPNESASLPTSSDGHDREQIAVFADAVQAGEVRPDLYNALWVETGTMSSSGSRSQLELPRYACRFFGFSFNRYIRTQATIGEVEISIDGAGAWTRSLAWHGDNGMERINLPTPRMLEQASISGWNWADKVVLFQRAAGNTFVLTAVTPDSSDAHVWQQESAANNNMYRLGYNSTRLCGLI